jgi:hypothetical protein
MTLVVRLVGRVLTFTLALWTVSLPAFAYSVLSHEALIDALWEVRIKALLLAQYPNATPDQLKHAHGYAYGGAIIQDLGYYPHGSEQFSDLTHYVRTGDFILAIIHEAKDLNELSFALGSLSHYVGDLDCHRFATNMGEPMLYPKLKKKFGAVITYEDSPSYHLKTEFGFDVLEVARGNFAPQAYHDFIGFYVSKDLVARAFRDTYGLELSDLFGDFDQAIESYRSAVSRTIPLATRIAWAQKRDEIHQAEPGISRHHFIYVMKRSSYQKEWGKRYDEPSFWDKFLAFLLRLIPPIGPLGTLQLKMPTPPVEKLFMDSFTRASQQYREKLDAVPTRDLTLTDENYDVGTVTLAGQYFMADDIQAFWLHKLARKNFATVTPDIRAELTTYFGNLTVPMKIKQEPDAWKQLQADYAALNAAPPVHN